jgi:hypothetical protein
MNVVLIYNFKTKQNNFLVMKTFYCNYSKTVMSFTHHCSAIVQATDKESAGKIFYGYLKDLGQTDYEKHTSIQQVEEKIFIITQGSN